MTASHPREPSPAIAALIAAKLRYISHLCGPSAMVPAIVVTTDISTPRHVIDFAEAGPPAQAMIVTAAAIEVNLAIEVNFMTALLVDAQIRERSIHVAKSPDLDWFRSLRIFISHDVSNTAHRAQRALA